MQAWISRGLAYERLGDKDKAAGSYARAMNINENNEPAETGFDARRRQVRAGVSDVLKRRRQNAAQMACVTIPTDLVEALLVGLGHLGDGVTRCRPIFGDDDDQLECSRISCCPCARRRGVAQSARENGASAVRTSAPIRCR